jgi:uncharacterized protein
MIFSFKKKIFYFIIINIFLLIGASAQTKKSEIKIIARGQKDKVLIRWGVTTSSEWKKALKTGFIVTRFTVKRGNSILPDPEKKVLTLKPLLPEPLESWMDLIQKDNYAAIVAQSIFGENFEVGDNNENSISKLINTADELDQRHTFGLFAADMSFEGSVKAGWGLVDSQVKKNEVYVYQVAIAGNTKVKPASAMIGVRDYKKLPAVEDLIAIADDKKVIISWDFESYKSIFTSYKIERSDDGVTFSPITNTPIVNMNEQKGVNSKRMYYIDTLSQNDKTYHYQLYGISAFGEKGQLSKTISSKGIHDVFYPPRLTDYKMQNAESVTLEWEYPKEIENHIDGFEINHAENDKGPYTKVSETILPDARHFEYKNLAPSNYFTISVIGKNKKRLTSQSMLVQPVDSIPPAKPIGLTGTIDSLGVVKIKWGANTEKDLLGYRILKANNENEEFIDIFQKPFSGTAYKDQVSLKLDTKKVYYRIAAEDIRYNMSEPSEILVLEKPDKIPPAAPIFRNYEIKDGKISLEWIRSYSDDVVSYSLQRKKWKDKSWLEIQKFTDTTQTFSDSSLDNNTTYQYAIVAKDKGGLVSSLENSVITVQFIDLQPIDLMQNVLAIADRELRKINLSWDYKKNKEKIIGLTIYKNKMGEAPALWKEILKPITALEDTQLSMNMEYEYHFTPILQSKSPSKTISVTVKY